MSAGNAVHALLNTGKISYGPAQEVSMTHMMRWGLSDIKTSDQNLAHASLRVESQWR